MNEEQRPLRSLGTEPAEVCMVLTTLDSQVAAEALAHDLLDAHLAACVQMHAVQSAYVWKGERQQCAEHLLLIKTTLARYPALEAFIEERHPYDTPEILCLPVLAGSGPYLAWVAAQTQAQVQAPIRAETHAQIKSATQA